MPSGIAVCLAHPHGREAATQCFVGPLTPADTLVSDALAALQAGTATASASTLTQQHALIRSADEHGELVAHATAAAMTHWSASVGLAI